MCRQLACIISFNSSHTMRKLFLYERLTHARCRFLDGKHQNQGLEMTWNPHNVTMHMTHTTHTR